MAADPTRIPKGDGILSHSSLGDRFFEIDNSLEKQSELPEALKQIEQQVKEFLK